MILSAIPIMTWVLYGLLSAVSAALVTIFAKIGLASVDATFATAIRSGIMFIFIMGATVIGGKWAGLATLSSKAWWAIILSGAAGALSWIFYFLAVKYGPASRAAALDRLSFFFIVLLSLIFLGETLSIKNWVGAAFILVGVILYVI